MKRTVASAALIMLTIVAVASVATRPARAEIVVFTAQMFANQETPPVTNADLNAFGNVTVTLDTVANTASFAWSVNNVAAPSIILSHIHEGPAGVAGPIRIDSGITPATPITVVGGSASFSKAGISTTAAQIAAIIANPSGFYFNVHSSLNPGGVVRGQLVRQAAAPTGGTPTLSEWGAILMGLLIVAACVFFLVRPRTGLAMVGSETSTSFEGQSHAIDWKLLARVTMYVEAAIVLGLIAFKAGPTDVVGALSSGLLIAFIVHVFVGAARRH
jgi:hypothetical protein